MNEPGHTLRGNQFCRMAIWIPTRQIDHQTNLFTENTTGEMTREKQGVPHDFAKGYSRVPMELMHEGACERNEWALQLAYLNITLDNIYVDSQNIQ